MANVTVKSKFGQLGTIDKGDLPEALKNGFTVPDNNEIDEHNNKVEYGSGLLNPALAGLEEAASTATFGASRQLENLSGLTTPEAQAERAKYNPMAHIAGIPVGLFADPFGAIGLLNKAGKATSAATRGALKAAPEGAGILAKAARNVPVAAAGAALEGAGFGVGQTVADQAMGHLNDPDTMAEHIAGNIGYGALLAGGLGGLLEGGANAFGKSTIQPGKIASLQSDINKGVQSSEDAASQVAAREQVEQMSAEAPTSLQQIQDTVNANKTALSEGLPSNNSLKVAVEGLPDLQFKPHGMQYESLADQGARDYYKTLLEGQSDQSKSLRDYESLQKREATEKLDKTIQDLAPGHKLSTDPVDAGERAVKTFTDQYMKEKSELAPIFKKIDKIAENKKANAFDSLLKIHDSLGDALGSVVHADNDGLFHIAPYKPTMALTEEAYKSVKDVVNAANEGSISLSELRNLRDSMKRHLDFTSGRAGEASVQVSKIRKALMDQMQESVSKVSSDIKVRETFKKYAQNEERRTIMEKIFGGSISDSASFAKTIKPEEVLNKLFSNTISVGAAKEILGNEFSKVAADYLAMNRAKVTDEARLGFSSNKFKTFLKTKGPELAEALGEAGSAKRLNDLTDYMRILPDSPSINPSGTAKTMQIMETISGLSRSLKPTEMLADYAQKYMSKAEAEKNRFTLDQVLAGKHFAAAKQEAEDVHLATSKLARLQRFAEDTAYKIQKGAESIFNQTLEAGKKSVGVIGSKLVPEDKKSKEGASLNKPQKVFARLEELQNNPEKMMQVLQDATANIFGHDPPLAQSLQTFSAAATSFLASKLPPTFPPSVLDEKYDPSASEVSRFERYYNVVEDPVSVFAQVKHGSLSPEAIETLGAVYPKLYHQMKLSLINEMSGHKKIPFKTRQQVSFFLGQPINSSLSPQSILTNQQVFLQSAQQHQMNQQPKPSKTGMGKMTIGDRTKVNQGPSTPT